jgi:thiol-disulfide isomerase/thioredoxin
LPDLTLPCFGPGDDVRIARLGVPAVINLWASWCGPCRAELPAFQRYAERVGDRLQVVGVNTEDTRTAAQSLVDDLRLRFPMLYDRQGALRKAVGKAGLPITLFVNARGQITFLYNAQALDDATLELLAEQHLGVAVPR